MKLKVNVHAYRQDVTINAWPGSHAERLYDKWYKSQSDEDWEDLLEWIRDDVAESMEIKVKDVDRL